MNEQILDLIEKCGRRVNFNYVLVNDEMIKTAEDTLNVKLPSQYVEFLKSFGHGGIVKKFEILGVGLMNRITFMETTLFYRNQGLPSNLVTIERVGRKFMCIDCNNEHIVLWDRIGNISDEFECFDDYLVDKFTKALEN